MMKIIKKFLYKMSDKYKPKETESLEKIVHLPHVGAWVAGVVCKHCSYAKQSEYDAPSYCPRCGEMFGHPDNPIGVERTAIRWIGNVFHGHWEIKRKEV